MIKPLIVAFLVGTFESFNNHAAYGFASISRIKSPHCPNLSTSSVIQEHRRQKRGDQCISFFSVDQIIETSFSLDTFGPQFLWLPMIIAPESTLTKKIMGPIVPILLFSLVHLTIVLIAAAQEGATDQILVFQEVFDPSQSQLAGMAKMFQFPNFVAEEWPHVLVWDLFVGRAIWLDGLERGINTRFALLFCNLIGPPGLLIYAATCILSGKGLPSMGFSDLDDDQDINEPTKS